MTDVFELGANGGVGEVSHNVGGNPLEAPVLPKPEQFHVEVSSGSRHAALGGPDTLGAAHKDTRCVAQALGGARGMDK